MVSKPGRRRFSGFSRVMVMSVLGKMVVRDSCRWWLFSNRGVVSVLDEIQVSLISLARLSRCSSWRLRTSSSSMVNRTRSITRNVTVWIRFTRGICVCAILDGDDDDASTARWILPRTPIRAISANADQSPGSRLINSLALAMNCRTWCSSWLVKALSTPKTMRTLWFGIARDCSCVRWFFCVLFWLLLDVSCLALIIWRDLMGSMGGLLLLLLWWW